MINKKYKTKISIRFQNQIKHFQSTDVINPTEFAETLLYTFQIKEKSIKGLLDSDGKTQRYTFLLNVHKIHSQ